MLTLSKSLSAAIHYFGTTGWWETGGLKLCIIVFRVLLVLNMQCGCRCAACLFLAGPLSTRARLCPMVLEPSEGLGARNQADAAI